MHCMPRAPLEPFDAGVDMSDHSLQVRRDGEVQTWRAVQIEQITPDQLYVAAISDDDRPALSATFGRDARIGDDRPQGHHHYLDAELSARCTVTERLGVRDGPANAIISLSPRPRPKPPPLTHADD